jgi:ParB family transcriptional regulator, chromosome partitioning protein
MAKKPALGRGLAALLREEQADGYLEDLGAAAKTSSEGTAAGQPAPGGGSGVVELPVTAIRRNPRQPRRAFDAGALEELATSIASVGVVQPVIVRQVDDGYELIAGERRWRAAQQAGFTVVPAIIRAASDVESLELALIENVVRQQLNPVDEAFALKVLLEDLGVTQEKLAARVGKSRSAIANKIRLLDLPGPIQESLASGELSEGHARALLGLGGRGEQVRMARRIAEKGLSVRQVEDEVRRKGEAAKPGVPTPASSLPGEVLDQIRDSFFGLFGVMPKVRDRGTGGVIELPFKDAEELAKLLDRLQ